MGRTVKQEIADMKFLIIAIALLGSSLENAQAQSQSDCISYLKSPNLPDKQQVVHCFKGLGKVLLACASDLTVDLTEDDIWDCFQQWKGDRGLGHRGYYGGYGY